jgi:hypothetical protein
MKENLLSKTSIFLSFINILIVLNINHDIALRYLSSDGKTRALFGITEILSFSYQYYLVILSVLSIVITFISIRKKEKKRTIILAISLSILSIVLIFSRIWRLMI